MHGSQPGVRVPLGVRKQVSGGTQVVKKSLHKIKKKMRVKLDDNGSKKNSRRVKKSMNWLK